MYKKYLIAGFLLMLIISGCGVNQALNAVSNQTSAVGSGGQVITSEAPLDTFQLKRGAAVTENTNYHDVSSITVLVNKQNPLSPDYVPADLVDVNIPFTFSGEAEKRKMNRIAALKLEELFNTARKNGIILYGVSGYRSYQTQNTIFESNIRKYGSAAKANMISAKPGESEHQTGLAMDITSESVNYGLEERFEDTSEYAWLMENAYNFGFIIRYPKGKEQFTEYSYEPWHLRYAGTELAAKLYQEKLSYEEYLFFKI